MLSSILLLLLFCCCCFYCYYWFLKLAQSVDWLISWSFASKQHHSSNNNKLLTIISQSVALVELPLAASQKKNHQIETRQDETSQETKLARTFNGLFQCQGAICDTLPHRRTYDIHIVYIQFGRFTWPKQVWPKKSEIRQGYLAQLKTIIVASPVLKDMTNEWAATRINWPATNHQDATSLQLKKKMQFASTHSLPMPITKIRRNLETK